MTESQEKKPMVLLFISESTLPTYAARVCVCVCVCMRVVKCVMGSCECGSFCYSLKRNYCLLSYQWCSKQSWRAWLWWSLNGCFKKAFCSSKWRLDRQNLPSAWCRGRRKCSLCVLVDRLHMVQHEFLLALFHHDMPSKIRIRGNFGDPFSLVIQMGMPKVKFVNINFQSLSCCACSAHFHR